MGHKVVVTESQGGPIYKGYRAECSCGWASKWRTTPEVAGTLGHEHVTREHPVATDAR